MRSKYSALVFSGLFFAFFTVSCQSNKVREPDVVSVRYDEQRKAALKTAIDHGIFFSLADDLILDPEIFEATTSCKKINEPTWSRELLSYLGEFKKSPSLYDKFHIIELKRGDHVGADLQEDLDGARTLVITYTKVENRSTIESLTEIPCSTQSMELIGKPLREVTYKYPTFNEIESLLQNKTKRPDIPRLAVSKEFLKYLADRLAILRFSSDLSFELNSKGDSLLKSLTTSMDEQLKHTTPRELNYWLAEIADKSFSSQTLRLFSLKRDIELSHGVKVENAEKFSPRTDELGVATPFISYRYELGDFKFVTLANLEKCLSRMRGKYLTFSNSMTTQDRLNNEPKFFLHPGFECR